MSEEHVQPELCCKCAAYEQIISKLHARIAEARRTLEDAKQFSQWSTDKAKKVLDELP